MILLGRGSLCRGDTAVEYLRKCMNANGRGLGNATLKQMNDITKIDLSIICTDQTDKQVLVLNHRTAPSCPVAYAVRMSMGIPFLWEDVIWRDKWGPYCGKNIAGHSIIDGGVLTNCPIEYVLEDRIHVRKVMGDTEITPDRVICFVFDTKTPLGWKTDTASKESSFITHLRKHTPLIAKVESLISTLLDGHDNQLIYTYFDKVVFIPAQEVETTEFSMPAEKIQLLIEKAAEKTHELLRAKGLIK